MQGAAVDTYCSECALKLAWLHYTNTVYHDYKVCIRDFTTQQFFNIFAAPTMLTHGLVLYCHISVAVTLASITLQAISRQRWWPGATTTGPSWMCGAVEWSSTSCWYARRCTQLSTLIIACVDSIHVLGPSSRHAVLTFTYLQLNVVVHLWTQQVRRHELGLKSNLLRTCACIVQLSRQVEWYTLYYDVSYIVRLTPVHHYNSAKCTCFSKAMWSARHHI